MTKPQLNKKRPLSLIARGRNFDYFIKQTANENWAVCSAYVKGKHVRNEIDIYFQMHSEKRCKEMCHFCSLMIDVSDERLIVKKEFKSRPGLIKIDQEALIEKYGKIFHSSIAWMLGYAIEKDYTDITIHGVDMLQSSEYKHQRDSVFFLMGYAKAIGIKINLPAYSGLNVFNKIYGE